MKKHPTIFSLSVIALSIALTQTARADDSNSSSGGLSSAGAAIAAANQLTNTLIFQYDPNVPTIVSQNQANSSSTQNTNQTAQSQAQLATNSQLSQIQQYAGLIKSSPYSYDTLLTNLTTNLPGSDTLMIKSNLAPPANLGVNPTPQQQNAVPANLSTNFSAIFNTDNLGSNSAYATNFLNFVGQTYQPLVSSDLQSAFSQYVSNISSGNNSSDLQPLNDDPNYLNFQADLRSYVANKSIGISNLTQLFNERMPQTASNGATLPSQLQTEEGVYTSRVNNPAWYQAMESASPATVQREMLFVLAEIEQQLYQQHLDSERIIAADSAQLILNSQLSKTELAMEENNLKDDLSGQASQAQQAQQQQQTQLNQQAQAIASQQGGGSQ